MAWCGTDILCHPPPGYGVSCRAGGSCPTSAMPCPSCLSRCFWVLPWTRAEGSIYCVPPTHARIPNPVPQPLWPCTVRGVLGLPPLDCPPTRPGEVSPYLSPAILLGQLSAGLPQPTPSLERGHLLPGFSFPPFSHSLSSLPLQGSNSLLPPLRPRSVCPILVHLAWPLPPP